AAVRRLITFDSKTEYLDASRNDKIDSDAYKDVQGEARKMARTVTVEEGSVTVGTANYTPKSGEWTRKTVGGPTTADDRRTQSGAYNNTLAAFAHETQQAVDDLTRAVKYRTDDEQKIHTEWRAWAAEAAVIYFMTIKHQRPFPRTKTALAES